MAAWMFLLTKKTISKSEAEVLEFDEEAAVKYDFFGKGVFAGYKLLSESGPLYTLNVPIRHFSA